MGANRPHLPSGRAGWPIKDGEQSPVVFLLGPVHGGEVEGLVGLLNLIRVAETGKDYRGQPWPALAENLARCRVLVVPLGNPDGRARFPLDSSIGRKLDDRQAMEMGTAADGKPYTWPAVKRIHPMRGPAVGRLGAYFNDGGINLMHDEWFEPMAAETRAFLRLAREEAPDLIVSLHSHAGNPSIEPTACVPRTIKQAIRQFGDRLQKRYAEAGLPHRPGGPEPKEDGTVFPPPSFNSASALHHVCGAAAMVHECCQGVSDAAFPRLEHEGLLDLEMLLFDELLRLALEHRIDWTPLSHDKRETQ